MKLGEHIKALRKGRGMTQEYLAERLQVTRQAVSKWENGSALPSMEKLLALAGLFEIPLEQLTGTAVPPVKGKGEQRRLKKWKLLFLLALAAFLLLLVWYLWQDGQQWGVRASSASAAASESAYERLENHLLGEAFCELPSGRSIWLRLVLSEGEYFTDAYEGYLPGGGTYSVNYRGSYRLEVWDREEKCLCTYPLNEDFDGQAMNFPGEVELSLFDYNRDGLPEFSIGQYGSSSANLYQIYTLDDSGNLLKCCAGPVADSSGLENFSVMFPCIEKDMGKGFYTRVWNNALGRMESAAYRWDEASGRFLPAG